MLELLKNFSPDDFDLLPPELDSLSKKIKQAVKHILALPEDFDEENSKIYQVETVDRAVLFVKKLAISALKVNNTVIPAPKILPGPDGSIDVCWKQDTFSLLINFPAEAEDLPTYFGEDTLGNTTEGSFDGSKLDQVFLFWLLDH
jgi:hypothetical protein